jgi:hypothetical protein
MVKMKSDSNVITYLLSLRCGREMVGTVAVGITVNT